MSDDIERLFDAITKKAEIYTIKKGDTFEKIIKNHPTALRERLMVQEMEDANPSIKPTSLQIGKNVIIPTGELLAEIRLKRQAPRASAESLLTKQIDEAFASAASTNGVDESVLRGIAMTETGGDICATSSAGAQGLMQLMPEIQRAYGVTDPFDPVSSIWGAAAHLSLMIRAAQQIMQYVKEGDIYTVALTMYNMGEGAYRNAIRTGEALPAEASEYSGKVISNVGARPNYHCNRKIV